MFQGTNVVVSCIPVVISKYWKNSALLVLVGAGFFSFYMIFDIMFLK